MSTNQILRVCKITKSGIRITEICKYIL